MFTEVTSPSDTAFTVLYVQFRCAKTQLNWDVTKKPFFAPNAEHTPHKAAALQENSYASGHSPLIASERARTKNVPCRLPLFAPRTHRSPMRSHGRCPSAAAAAHSHGTSILPLFPAALFTHASGDPAEAIAAPGEEEMECGPTHSVSV